MIEVAVPTRITTTRACGCQELNTVEQFYAATYFCKNFKDSDIEYSIFFSPHAAVSDVMEHRKSRRTAMYVARVYKTKRCVSRRAFGEELNDCRIFKLSIQCDW
jgi:hypothetical protein